MPSRNVTRVMKRVVRLWPLWFLALWLTIMTIFTTSSLDSHIFNPSSPFPEMGLNDNSFVVGTDSVIKEELIGHQSGHSLVIRASGVETVQLIEVYQVRRTFAEEITYLKLPFDDKVYVTDGTNLSDSKSKAKNDEIHKYFELIRTKTGSCRKLIRVGGTLNCNNTGDNNWMDGHKILCFDPAFQITRSKVTDCVVLSYGIQLDTTFDEGMSNMKCDVYMYDIGNFSKPYFRKENRLYFHQIGLDTEKAIIYNTVYNVTTHFDNINNMVMENGIEDKLINVLKIDIEGYEWKILYDICSKPYINLIGQIAIEVHAIDLLKLNKEERNKKAKYFMGAIKALEAKGFRIVFYWDNIQPKYVYTDEEGLTYETAGEMLLINYNWYNETFREEVRKLGYNFEFL